MADQRGVSGTAGAPAPAAPTDGLRPTRRGALAIGRLMPSRPAPRCRTAGPGGGWRVGRRPGPPRDAARLSVLLTRLPEVVRHGEGRVAGPALAWVSACSTRASVASPASPGVSPFSVHPDRGAHTLLAQPLQDEQHRILDATVLIDLRLQAPTRCHRHDSTFRRLHRLRPRALGCHREDRCARFQSRRPRRLLRRESARRRGTALSHPEPLLEATGSIADRDVLMLLFFAELDHVIDEDQRSRIGDALMGPGCVMRPSSTRGSSTPSELGE